MLSVVYHTQIAVSALQVCKVSLNSHKYSFLLKKLITGLYRAGILIKDLYYKPILRCYFIMQYNTDIGMRTIRILNTCVMLIQYMAVSLGPEKRIVKNNSYSKEMTEGF